MPAQTSDPVSGPDRRSRVPPECSLHRLRARNCAREGTDRMLQRYPWALAPGIGEFFVRWVEIRHRHKRVVDLILQSKQGPVTPSNCWLQICLPSTASSSFRMIRILSPEPCRVPCTTRLTPSSPAIFWIEYALVDLGDSVGGRYADIFQFEQLCRKRLGLGRGIRAAIHRPEFATAGPPQIVRSRWEAPGRPGAVNLQHRQWGDANTSATSAMTPTTPQIQRLFAELRYLNLNRARHAAATPGSGNG